MDHSVRGYLRRRSTQELEGFLQMCLREKGYRYAMKDVLDELEKRYAPEQLPPHVIQVRQMLAEQQDEK